MWEPRVARTSRSSVGDDRLLVWLGDPDGQGEVPPSSSADQRSLSPVAPLETWQEALTSMIIFSCRSYRTERCIDRR